MLSCPDCDYELTTTRIETGAPGGTIDVDRCPYCGGVWFDHYEVNRLPAHEATRLSNLATLASTPHPKGTEKCPHCGVMLTRLVASSLPKNVRVLHCSHCRGNWISKVELSRVKAEQQKALTRFKVLGVPLPSLSAVLIPILIIAFLAGSIPVTLSLIRRTKETRLRAREIIATPTVIPIDSVGAERIVLISFTSTIPVRSSIVLKGGQVTSPRVLTVSDTARLLHVIRLTDLASQTTYTYSIRAGDEQGQEISSEQFTFTTR